MNNRDSKYKQEENVALEEGFFSIGQTFQADEFTDEKEALKKEEKEVNEKPKCWA